MPIACELKVSDAGMKIIGVVPVPVSEITWAAPAPEFWMVSVPDWGPTEVGANVILTVHELDAANRLGGTGQLLVCENWGSLKVKLEIVRPVLLVFVSVNWPPFPE